MESSNVPTIVLEEILNIVTQIVVVGTHLSNSNGSPNIRMCQSN